MRSFQHLPFELRIHILRINNRLEFKARIDRFDATYAALNPPSQRMNRDGTHAVLVIGKGRFRYEVNTVRNARDVHIKFTHFDGRWRKAQWECTARNVIYADIHSPSIWFWRRWSLPEGYL